MLHLVSAPAVVRAQALPPSGEWVDDYHFVVDGDAIPRLLRTIRVAETA